jgi:hypothetical protein
VDFFVEYKWFVMVAVEVLFWVLAIAFGLIRYLFGRERLSLVVLALLVINYSLLVPIAILDYLQSRDIELFQIATVAFIIYVLIYGKSHFKHFDAAMKRKVSQWKGETPPRSAGVPK